MDSAPPMGANGAPQSVDQLPPEAIALASRFFDAARQGQMDMLEQALPHGLPANLTNDKGDTLVSGWLAVIVLSNHSLLQVNAGFLSRPCATGLLAA